MNYGSKNIKSILASTGNRIADRWEYNERINEIIKINKMSKMNRIIKMIKRIKTRLFTMRSKPNFVEFVCFVEVFVNVVVVVLINVAIHKGLVLVNKSLSDTH